MASRSSFSSEETFFNGSVRDSQIVLETERDEFVNSTVISSTQTSINRKSKGKESLSPYKAKAKNAKMRSSNKENAIQTVTGEKKRGRPSGETKREALKVLNVTFPGQSPNAKSKASTKKRVSNVEPPLPKASAEEKKSVPKIVIYEDGFSEESGCKEKVKKGKSRSLDGRRSAPEKKSPKLVVRTRSKSVRLSVKDATNSKSPKASKQKSPRSTVTTRNKSVSPKLPKPELSPSGERGILPLTDSEMKCLLEKLETLFPKLDPEFLRALFIKLKKSLSATIEYIILNEESGELPTKADFMSRLETERLQKEYLKNFSVEDFLRKFPDPWKYFLRPVNEERKNYSEESFYYLKNKFKKHYSHDIQRIFEENRLNLYKTAKELQKKNRKLKMRVKSRSKAESGKGPLTYNENFMHEVGFIENEAKIKLHMKRTETAKHKKFIEAKKAGKLRECMSCNDPSLLSDDAVNCLGNHVFCKDCVVKSVDAELSKNNFRFKCLIKCEEIFPMESLQKILTSEAIAKIDSRNQLEEIRAAEIEDLVWCPFCSYATIMPPEMSVLCCLNPGCLKESCRHCKQINHMPLQCPEMKKFAESVLDGKAEEEKEEEEEEEEESSSSVLTCIECDKEFLETDETNKLACPCGGTICSICRQPFPECPHFKAEPAERGPTGVLSASTSSDVSVTADDPENRARAGSFDFSRNLADFYPGNFYSL